MVASTAFKHTEVGTIPVEWHIQPCEKLADRIMVGIVIRPTQYYVENGVPAFRSANIREDGINENDLVYISEASNALLAKSQTRDGDVLTVRTGYPGTSAVVRTKHSGWNCIDIILTRPSKRVLDSDYLAIWVNSSFGKTQVLRNQGGLAQKHFNVGDMKKLMVALPPLPEQKAIATALSDVDALIASLDKLIEKKRNIKQGVMQELLNGKKRLPGFEGEWSVAPLGTCLSRRPDYGINAPAVSFSDVLPTYIRITDISEAGQFVPETKVSVAHPDADDYVLNEGDIVLARTGASVGKSYLYRKDDGPLVYAGFLIRVTPDPNVLLPGFLASIFQTTRYWHWVSMMSMRSGQPGINSQEYASFEVPLPSPQEQRAIADCLIAMDDETNGLLAKLRKAKLVKQGMMQELLTGKTRLV